jgi:peptidase E
MAVRHVVAMGGGGFSMDDPLLDRFLLDLVDSSSPRVCFIPTASGDSASYSDKFTTAFTAYGAQPSVLSLFYREVDNIVEFLASQDVIYVGGGNTVNMLKIWEIHGVDAALHMAWENGVVLAGLSAGANCWFEAFTTDSYRVGRADPAEGLGFLSGSFSPHHSSEPARRPEYARLIAAGDIPAGYACDDFAAIHFTGDAHQAITSRPEAAAYRVSQADGGSFDEVKLTAAYLG